MEKDYFIGQSGQYEYRHGKQIDLVAAHIVAIDGTKIQIEFIHPTSQEYKRGVRVGAYPQRTWLRNPADRARFHIAHNLL